MKKIKKVALCPNCGTKIVLEKSPGKKEVVSKDKKKDFYECLYGEDIYNIIIFHT